MPTVTPIQTSFAGGEISPRMKGRVDSDLYRAALDFCEDWEITPQGALLRRPGSKYDCPWVRGGLLRAIQGRDRHGYLVELGSGKVEVRSADGLLANAGAPLGTYDFEQVLNGMFSSADNWTVSGGQIAGGILTLLEDGYAEQTIAEVHDTGMVHRFVFTIGHLEFGRGCYVRLQSGPVTIFETTIWATTAITEGTDFAFDVPIPDGMTSAVLRFEHLLGQGLDELQLTMVGLHCPLGRYYHSAAPWTATQQLELTCISYPDLPNGGLILLHRDVKPYQLWLDRCYWRLEPVAFTGAPTAWRAHNWPTVGTFFQGRLWLSGVASAPGMWWASKSGDPVEFTVDAQPSASSSFSARTSGAIRWMQGKGGALLMGTDRNEVVLGSQGGLVCGLDLQLQEESGFGSAPLPALPVGDQVFFVGRDGRKVRTLDYDQRKEAWEGRDVTFLGEHLVDGIVEMAFARDPDGILAVLCADGLRCCTYNREAGVAAWWRCTVDAHHLTVTEGPEGSILWVCVQRGAYYTIEHLIFGDPEDRAEVDGFFWAPVVADTITVPYLAAQEAVLYDAAGVEHAIAQVPGNGILDVSAFDVGETALIGQAMLAKAVTLPPEAGSQRGTAQGSRRRWPRVVARLNDSGAPKINGERAVLRGAPLAAGRLTGDVVAHTLASGADRGQLTLEQDRGIRSEVVALFGILQGSEV